MEERIAHARQLLAEIHHVPIATVNPDGTPHNSPVFMAFDDQLRGYWASHPSSQHSRNIAREGGVFLVIFDSREGHGGLYITAQAEALEDRAEAAKGHQVLHELKERFYGAMGGLDEYLGPDTQRIYRVILTRAWINMSERNQAGVIIKDTRYEVPLTDLY